MSCVEDKTVLRVEIPRLSGINKTEAFNYFKKILGEPNDIDNDEKEVYYFEYNGRFQPVYDSNNKKWGIDLVLAHKSTYKTYIQFDYKKGITLKEFGLLADELCQKFDIKKEDVKLLSFSWYNGGAEPISF